MGHSFTTAHATLRRTAARVVGGHGEHGRVFVIAAVAPVLAIATFAGALAPHFATDVRHQLGISLGDTGAPDRGWHDLDVQSLDGSGNNKAHPDWGRAGTPYSRVAPARYADGHSAPLGGPNTRYVSNRVFNDANQNIFSERNVSQWGFVWGQFLDHTFGLRDNAGPEQNIPFDAKDPLESFTDTLGFIPFSRSAAAAGTGVTDARQQTNTVSSYIDAWAVYGGSPQRLEWLRDGPLDGDLRDNAATLMLPGGYLPRRDARGNAATAPPADVDGRLLASPNIARIAGDLRANENIALTATHTLFAREHNRVVGLLANHPELSAEDKFQIARRIVIAEQQFITYTEFMPAMGIRLPAYRGYDPSVDPTLSNEFATVGYRAHSQIHGELEFESTTARYTAAQLAALGRLGIKVAVTGPVTDIGIPLGVASFNPDLVPAIGLGPLLEGIGSEAQYDNDEQIDNQLRSVLFQIPVPGNLECLDGPTLAECYRGVLDLGAIDIERGRDHGIPSYNQLRQAYGLAPKTSFTAITGETTDQFPADPALRRGHEIDDPASLDITNLTDVFGADVDRADEDAMKDTPKIEQRRSTVAARLRAIYGGDVDKVDAFVGMVAEQHAPGVDMGELQRAMWTRQFGQLRDGDRFFYGNDPGLTLLRQKYGLDFRRNLGDLISLNTDVPRDQIGSDVFFAHGEVAPESCTASFVDSAQGDGAFEGTLKVTNTGSWPIDAWALRWQLSEGYQITKMDYGELTQEGIRVTVNDKAGIGNRSTVTIHLAGTGDAESARPANLTLNTTPCGFG